MSKSESVKIPMCLHASTGMIIVALAIAMTCVEAQQTSAAAQPSLQRYFADLVQNYNPESTPTFDDLLKVQDRIGSMQPAEISAAMPSILTALTHPDDTIKSYALAALFALGLRPDSAALLKDYIKPIADFMNNSTNGRLEGASTQILGMLKPQPPPEVEQVLLAFLRSTDRDLRAQSSAIFFLVRIAPDDIEVIDATKEFLSRPLTREAREGALNAISSAYIRNTRLIAVFIDALTDPDSDVRLTAVQGLQRIGRDAVQQAEPALRELMTRPEEPPEVKAAADEAVKSTTQAPAPK